MMDWADEIAIRLLKSSEVFWDEAEWEDRILLGSAIAWELRRAKSPDLHPISEY